MLSGEDHGALRVYHRKAALERALAEELRAEIKVLQIEHPDWPSSYVRVQANRIMQDAINQVKIPH